MPILALYAESKERDHPNGLFYEEFDRMGLRADVVRVKVNGAGHRDFTDLALLADKQHLDHLGPVDGERVTGLVAALTTAFLDRFVRGTASRALPFGEGTELVEVSHVREWGLSRAGMRSAREPGAGEVRHQAV